MTDKLTFDRTTGRRPSVLGSVEPGHARLKASVVVAGLDFRDLILGRAVEATRTGTPGLGNGTAAATHGGTFVATLTGAIGARRFCPGATAGHVRTPFAGRARGLTRFHRAGDAGIAATDSGTTLGDGIDNGKFYRILLDDFHKLILELNHTTGGSGGSGNGNGSGEGKQQKSHLEIVLLLRKLQDIYGVQNNVSN